LTRWVWVEEGIKNYGWKGKRKRKEVDVKGGDVMRLFR